ncbi:hypothetical protein KP509_01G067800 [Ceratopteris richardii]|uniref:30S ribosomal protein S8, chloroplastic n=1 Tax=Ceratopteris richardii TaxID=49495 RepID=A0A8T2VQF7_CERRI|nr:hypothetical protein KP509_01G067800 [Ceratopteris richardii]KAH7446669.1 hypothetical protein KP509_01G067800 [Ceratopteris richardii]
MGRSSVLNDALRTMYNAERRCKREVLLKTTSNLLENFLVVMQKHGFVGEVRREVENRVPKLHVELHGRLNKVGACNPRYEVGVSKIKWWTDRLLPMRQFGYVVLTTSQGVMDHEEAQERGVGGQLLGFFY